jgi:TonB family protein
VGVLACLVLLMTTSLALAGKKTGLKAYENENYEKAFDHLMPVAEEGDAQAQFLLGEMYRSGNGASTNFGKAADWYRKAADQGHVEAQFELARMRSRGQAHSSSDEETVRLYRAAALQGHVQAQHTLGNLYDEGDGAPQDTAMAFRFFQLCAAQGDADCKAHVGWMYAEGRGVETDAQRAVRWLRESVIGGDPYGEYYLALMYLDGRGLPQDTAEAIRLLERAVTNEIELARIKLARLYFEGKVVERDPLRSVKLTAIAAASGEQEARELIGELVDGLTEEELAGASDEVSEFYDSGQYRAAFLLAQLLAQHDVLPVRSFLGRMYALGYGTPRNSATAYRLLLLGDEDDLEGLMTTVAQRLDPDELATVENPAEYLAALSKRLDTEKEREAATVGENGVTWPFLRTKIRPSYPERARLDRKEGRVILQMVLAETGIPADLFVISCDSPGFGFEEESMAAVAQWRYRPARLKGEPIAVKFKVRVDFEVGGE